MRKSAKAGQTLRTSAKLATLARTHKARVNLCANPERNQSLRKPSNLGSFFAQICKEVNPCTNLKKVGATFAEICKGWDKVCANLQRLGATFAEIHRGWNNLCGNLQRLGNLCGNPQRLGNLCGNPQRLLISAKVTKLSRFCNKNHRSLLQNKNLESLWISEWLGNLCGYSRRLDNLCGNPQRFPISAKVAQPLRISAKVAEPLWIPAKFANLCENP